MKAKEFYIINNNCEVLEATNVASEIRELNIRPDEFYWAELRLEFAGPVIVSATSFDEAFQKFKDSGILIQGGLNPEIDFDIFRNECNVEIRAETLESLLKKTKNFWYHGGFGKQYLFGKIVLKNGGWFQRVEYDGSECWEFFKTPEEPEWVKQQEG